MHTKQTRRAFLKAAGAAALAPAAFTHGALRQTRKPAFAPQIGVCTLLKNAEVLRDSGAEYIEVGLRRALIPDKSADEFARNLKAARECGLPIRAANGFLPGSLKSTGPAANHPGVLQFAETAFRRAKQVGIHVIVFGSSGSRSIPGGFDHDQAQRQFIELLERMGPLAESHGVVVGVESLQKSECNFINTLSHAARIARAVNHPNIRLVADIFHMLRMSEAPDDIRKAGDLVCHVHIAEKAQRTPPGVAGDDFQQYFQALKDAGFRGRISIECGWKDLSKQLPIAIKTLRGQLARVA